MTVAKKRCGARDSRCRTSGGTPRACRRTTSSRRWWAATWKGRSQGSSERVWLRTMVTAWCVSKSVEGQRRIGEEMLKQQMDAHPHLRSYVGQARVQVHSAIKQLEKALEAFGPGTESRDHPLYEPAFAVRQLLSDLRPVGEYVVYAHGLVIERT